MACIDVIVIMARWSGLAQSGCLSVTDASFSSFSYCPSSSPFASHFSVSSLKAATVAVLSLLSINTEVQLANLECMLAYMQDLWVALCGIFLRWRSIKLIKLWQNLEVWFVLVVADDSREYRPLKGLKLNLGHTSEPEARQALLDFCKQCKADRNCYIAIEDLEVACIDGRPMKLGSSLFGVVSNNSMSMASHAWRLTSYLELAASNSWRNLRFNPLRTVTIYRVQNTPGLPVKLSDSSMWICSKSVQKASANWQHIAPVFISAM